MTINVADDYSPFVLGRFPTDSKYNGEEFRITHLVPALKKLQKDDCATLTVNLDGTFSPDTSFLEEAFGGAVRDLKAENINSAPLWNRVNIIYDEAAQKKEILGYIEDQLNAYS